MYRIMKEWHFDAAHRLDGLEPGHQCSRMHGHTYRVQVELESEQLDSAGMVVDYRKIKWIGDLINGMFDHQIINERMPLNPTAENIADYLCATIMSALSMIESAPTIPDTLEVVTTPIKLVITGVSPLPDRVRLAAVRVSETGTTWAECRP